MKIDYKEIVPWCRSFEEYVKMLALTQSDLNLKIMDCGGGPSSFNSEMARRGKRVVSIDPIYNLSVAELKRRIDETYDGMIRVAREVRIFPLVDVNAVSSLMLALRKELLKIKPHNWHTTAQYRLLQAYCKKSFVLVGKF